MMTMTYSALQDLHRVNKTTAGFIEHVRSNPLCRVQQEIRHLDDRTIADLLLLDDDPDETWCGVEKDEYPQLPFEAVTEANATPVYAYVRSEWGEDCGCKDVFDPYVVKHSITGVEICCWKFPRGSDLHVLDHDLCRLRRYFRDHPIAATWRSRKHAAHRLANLKPTDRSPLPKPVQEDYIAKLGGIRGQIIHQEARGWVLLGPTGCSKSTYVSAVLTDVETYRRAYGARSVGITRLRVGDWLNDTQAWNTREFGAEDARPTTVEEIAEWSGCFAPILWLEEIDRFTVTETRMNLLFRLVDAVYEAEGCIIITANSTLADLKEKFDPALIRRFTGEMEDGGYTKWNMYAHATKTTKVA